MDDLQKELVAIGATVTANCIPCLKLHIGKARAAGASEAHIAEAIRIGRKVRTGSSEVWDAEAEKIMG